MKKLIEFLALNKTTGEVGLEIEVEGDNLPNLKDHYWKSVRDGSLRNGLEYVLSKPVPIKFVPKLVNYLNKKFESNQAVVQWSFRTSVHVHLNVQEFTHVQVLNLLYTYLLLEGPLLKYCHDVRSGNRFCLRAQDAEGLLTYMEMLFKLKEYEAYHIIPKDMIRYASINVEAIKKYGSVEFRSLEGTMDTDRITTWVNMLYAIYSYAKVKESPAHIHDEFIKTSPVKFMENVLGELSKNVLTKDSTDQINQSFSLTIDLPFAYKDSIEKEKVSKQLKKPDQDRFNEFVFVNAAFPEVGNRVRMVLEDNPAPIRDDRANHVN